MGPVVIETQHLLLRPWRAVHRAPYAAMMADPEVGYWLGGALTEAEANRQVDHFIAAGGGDEPGFLAVESRADGTFLGAACLRGVTVEEHPMAGSTEIGWRFARAAWGAGYATEAARALLDHGFGPMALPEIVAFTTTSNLRSQAVMRRLAMSRRPDLDFDHPALAPDHPLLRHVVYAIERP